MQSLSIPHSRGRGGGGAAPHGDGYKIQAPVKSKEASETTQRVGNIALHPHTWDIQTLLILLI